MSKIVILIFLMITFVSCKKEEEIKINSVKDEKDALKVYDNVLQKDLERTINDSMVKVIQINDKIVSKQEALNVKIIDVTSTTIIRNNENDSIEFKINLSK